MIRETGLNQDGKTTTITSPSVESQVKLIQDCYERAGLDLSDTGYVEAHMTGTKTGDLAEAQALARTFGASREPGDSVLVGSIKTNIGHTEPVSGLAALIKAVFVVETGVVPPNLNYDNPNPTIFLKEWNLQVSFQFQMIERTIQAHVVDRYLLRLLRGRVTSLAELPSTISDMEVVTLTRLSKEPQQGRASPTEMWLPSRMVTITKTATITQKKRTQQGYIS